MSAPSAHPTVEHVGPYGDWVNPMLDALLNADTDTDPDSLVRALLAKTGWEVADHRFSTGSVYTNIHATQGERIVAAKAGWFYLLHRPDTGAWVSLWVPYTRIVAGDPVLWVRADAKQRSDWVAAAVVAESEVAGDLASLLDRHEQPLSTDPRERLRVYDPDFIACSTILTCAHPDAEAVQFLAALSGWTGPGLRNEADQPLLGRVRDVEFAALSGTMLTELKDIITGWLLHQHPMQDESTAKQKAMKLTGLITRGQGFTGLPDILPPVTVEAWPELVHLWCASLASS